MSRSSSITRAITRGPRRRIQSPQYLAKTIGEADNPPVNGVLAREVSLSGRPTAAARSAPSRRRGSRVTAPLRAPRNAPRLAMRDRRTGGRRRPPPWPMRRSDPASSPGLDRRAISTCLRRSRNRAPRQHARGQGTSDGNQLIVVQQRQVAQGPATRAAPRLPPAGAMAREVEHQRSAGRAPRSAGHAAPPAPPRCWPAR
jgi:hypothetical protein